MEYLVELLQQYGLVIVFINVFIDQLGLPIPSYVTLLVTGAMTVDGHLSIATLLALAVSGALLADVFWYFAGRRYGKRVLSKLCRLSLSPDSCVKQTEALYLRMGPSALLFCKFIPGFASISSVLAGSSGTKVLVFIIMDALGAVIWAGSAIWLGYTFDSVIDQVLAVLMEMGKWGGALVMLALTAFIAWKWFERYSFLRELRMARISVDDLYELMEQGKQPVIFDTRAPELVEDGWIPGARFLPLAKLEECNLDIANDDFVVLYCSCPNEVTAAKIAKALIDKGYINVRPLAGGIDAWKAAGYEIEMKPV
jgi:membrane protein DedA with SNARE-associated domain/rhodanese-related sulfurtransferase